MAAISNSIDSESSGKPSIEPDWADLENAIGGLLSASDTASGREHLLRDLTAYAASVISAARRLRFSIPDTYECRDAMNWLLHPVFLCGHHRTGTTLLHDLLDGHPELMVLPSEGTYLTSFRYVARAKVSETDIDRFARDWIRRLIDPNHEPHFKLGRTGTGSNPYLGLVSRLFGWNAALRGREGIPPQFAPLLALAAAFRDVATPTSVPRRWVEKTPLNEFHVATLAQFPHAQFVQIVREPSATLASLRELHLQAGLDFDLAQHAKMVGRSLLLAARNQRQYGDRYLVVRYEDLTNRPGQEMERVRTFLGISPSDSLCEPTVLGQSVASNSSFGQGEVGVVRSARSMPLLNHREKRIVDVFAAGAAAHFGYNLKPRDFLSQTLTRIAHMVKRPRSLWRGRLRQKTSEHDY